MGVLAVAVLAAGLVVRVAVRVGGGVAVLVVMGAVRVHAEAVLVMLVVVLAVVVLALVLVQRVSHALEREGVDAWLGIEKALIPRILSKGT